MLMPDSQTPGVEKARSDEPTSIRRLNAANVSVPSSFAASGTYDVRIAESGSLGEIREFVTPV